MESKISARSSRKEQKEKKKDRRWAKFSVLINCALTIFTFLLYLVALNQTKIAQNSFESNERLITADLRAYVVFDTLRHIRFLPNQFPYISIDIKNVGKTPARNLIIRLWLTKEVIDSQYFFDHKTIVENDASVGTILASNMSGNKDAFGNVKISLDDIKDVATGKIAMSIMGILKYNDVFGKRHWTYICMKYRPPSERLPIGNGNFITYTNFNDIE